MTKLSYRPMAALCGGFALLLSGCVDDKYDFDNIDDTMRIEVKNLTIPLRFEDGITFSDLIDTDEIKTISTVNNEYVILRKGDFKSGQIEIAAISGKPAIVSTSQPIPLPAIAGQTIELPTELVKYSKFDFEFEYTKVDRFIRAITGGDVAFDIELKVNTGLPCTYNDLSFIMPTGMFGYVSESGNMVATVTTSDAANDYEKYVTIRFKDVKTSDGKFEFTFHVDRLALPQNAVKPNEGETAEDGTKYGLFSIANTIALGSCSITADQTGQGEFDVALNLEKFKVRSINGSVKYNVDDFEQTTNLGDLPDLLKDPATNLSLANPQIYLKINNPFAVNNIKANTNIEIKQGRENVSDFIDGIGMQASTIEPIEIGAEAEQSFVLSDTEPTEFYEGFAGAKWCGVSGLGDIVYGKGMPDCLDFRFYDIILDSDDVKDFPIGTNVDGIDGEYVFYAPLAFGENAQVVYTQEQTGWDIEDMVITGLEITADVASTIPVAVRLNAYPIVKDKDGQSKVVEDIEIASNEIGGLKDNEKVTIKMEFKGEKQLTNLDGMRYTATLKSADSGAIGPDQEISLKNLRITISGYYDINGDDK